MIVEALLLLVMLMVYAVIRDRRPSNMPPGPTEIPFIGTGIMQYLPQMENLRLKYGNIFTTRIGTHRQVTICDYKVAKEAYGNIDFADRPVTFTLFNINENENGGVIGSNGQQWVHDRRFVLRNLRDLGMGRTYLEQAINIEAQALVEDIKSMGEQPMIQPRTLRTAVLNVVWQMVASKRYDLKSTEVDKIFAIAERFRETSFMIFLFHFFPVLNILPDAIKKKLSKIEVLDEFRSEMKNIIKECIDDHERDLDVNDSRDLVDEYLIEMKKRKEEDPNDSTFRYGALEQIISDLFGAGSETVTNSLKWVVNYMVTEPETMRRCQEEIDSVVAPGSIVSLEHRMQLPYVEAFVAETIRRSSMIFMGVQRTANKDTTIQGYFIPKGCDITTNSYHIHHDPEFWDNPNEFRPERFLDENGRFQASLGRTVAFGTGRRQCVGEALARMELYLFSAAILQNFHIELPKGATFNDEAIGNLGFRLPVDQKFIYRSRN